jgi:hypothetical protein
MTARYFLLLVILLLFNETKLSAQIDDFKMRHEQECAQLKSQELALIPQKAYSFSSEHTKHLHVHFTDLLKNQTSFYLAGHSIYNSEIYYQNRRTSPTIAIQNVDFASSILENNIQLIQNFQPQAFESIQLYQGYSITQLQSNSAQFAVNYAIKPKKRDSFGYRIKAQLGGSNMDYSGFFQYALHKKKWNYLVNIFGGQQYRYALGTTGHDNPWLSWQRLANTFNGSGFWSTRSDTMVNTQPNAFLGIGNLLNLKLNPHSELNIYLYIGGRQETNLGRTIQKGANYFYSESNNTLNPTILAFVQKINNSETSPFFNQLNLALTYQHITNHSSHRYVINDDLYRQNNEENKISLQARAYKNFTTRHILFYGGEAATTFIKTDLHTTDLYTSALKDPILKFTSYLKYEWRQSSDISWFAGIKVGAVRTSFQFAPFYSQVHTVFRPHAEFNLSWLRHICESSNYGIHVFLRSKTPSLTELAPMSNHVFVKPNPNLKNETELLIESHLYRKFGDKFEIHFSPYFRYSWDAIVLQDHFGNPSERIGFGSNQFYTQVYTNQSRISEGGAELELRYNFSKNLLVYHQLNAQHVWTRFDATIFYPSLPIFGNLGLKFRWNKLFLHTWLVYNGGRNFSDSSQSQYIQYYAYENQRQKTFPSYMSLNLGVHFQLSSRLSAQFNIDNVLDQYSLDFLSTLPNAGRRLRLQLACSF